MHIRMILARCRDGCCENYVETHQILIPGLAYVVPADSVILLIILALTFGGRKSKSTAGILAQAFLRHKLLDDTFSEKQYAMSGFLVGTYTRRKDKEKLWGQCSQWVGERYFLKCPTWALASASLPGNLQPR